MGARGMDLSRSSPEKLRHEYRRAIFAVHPLRTAAHTGPAGDLSCRASLVCMWTCRCSILAAGSDKLAYYERSEPQRSMPQGRLGLLTSHTHARTQRPLRHAHEPHQDRPRHGRPRVAVRGQCGRRARSGVCDHSSSTIEHPVSFAFFRPLPATGNQWLLDAVALFVTMVPSSRGGTEAV